MAETQPIDEYFASLAASTTGVSKVPGLNAAGTAVQDVSAFLFDQGNQTLTAGSKMKISRIINDSATWPAENEGSIWAGNVYTEFMFQTTFDTSHVTTVNAGPAIGLFSLVNNDSGFALLETVAVMGDNVVRRANGVGFGANLIARDDGVAARLVGTEIDLEFSSGGSVIAGSGGMYINGFNKTNIGPAIQLGGLGGGKFTNGIILDAIVGTGMAPNTGATMTSMINTGTGVFSDAAIIMSNTHRIKLLGTASTHGYLYNDATDALRIVLGGASIFAVRDNADANTLFSFAAGGVLTLAAPNATTEYRGNGVKILGAARGASLPADATDLATAITLINTLKSRLSAAGAAEHPLFP